MASDGALALAGSSDQTDASLEMKINCHERQSKPFRSRMDPVQLK
jgi:hypothetical protein